MPYTPEQVAEINRNRAANVAAGVSAYSGAGATQSSAAKGKGGSTASPLYTSSDGGKSYQKAVMTSNAAQLDKAKKMAAFNEVQARNAQQAAKLAQQQMLEQQSQAMQSKEEQNQKNIQAGIDQKGQEIAAKNAALGLATGGNKPSSIQVSASPGVSGSISYETTSGGGTGSTGGVPTGPVSPYNQYPIPSPYKPTQGQTLNNFSEQAGQAQDQLISEGGAVQAKRDKLAKETVDKLNRVLKGTFPLSQPQQSLINSLKTQLEQNVADQKVANESFTGSVKMAGFRAGGEYTPEHYAGRIAGAVSFGIAKIQRLDNEAAITLATLENDFQKQNYDMITQNYDIMEKQLQEKADAVTETYKSAMDILKEERDMQLKVEQSQYERGQDAISNNLNERKYALDERESLSRMATDQLQREKLRIEIKQAAEQTGGSPDDLMAYANEYSATGKLPSPAELKLSGLTVGQVTMMAKQTPKQNGALVSSVTGGKAANLSSTQEDGITALYDLTKKLDDLSAIYSERNVLLPTQMNQQYEILRSEFVDLLARARTGAAITAFEQAEYLKKLPSATAGQINFYPQTKIKGLKSSLEGKLNTSLNTNQLMKNILLICIPIINVIHWL